MTAALPLLLLVGTVIGFIIGWAAHREEDRQYVRSREAFWARKLAEALAPVQVAAPARAPTVVHVHMPVLPPAPPVRQPRVIEAQLAEELPPVRPVDLDALTASG